MAVAAIALLVSCEKENGSDIPQRNDIVLTRAESEVMEAGNDFSFGLLREIAQEKDYRNIFLSPISAHIATCMLANGATGETYSQIVNTLGYDGFSIDDVNSAYRTLLEGLKRVDTSTELDIANSIWVKDDFPVSSDYVSDMAEIYDAYVKNLDFKSSSAIKTINSWCSQKTGKMIPSAIDRIEDETVMLLMNAVYFKGKWKERFSGSDTYDEEFTTLGGQKQQRDFMHITKQFKYSQDEDGRVRMCEIPYGNGGFVMDVVLPDTDIDFREFIAGMTGEKWKDMFTYTGSHEVVLSLPKFKLESNYELTDALMAMGMELPYDKDKADLKKMCSDPLWQLWVGKTTQKSVIEVDEKGTKAATVTTHHVKGETAAGPPAGRVVFKADHPFLFLIRETTSDTILFIGTLTD